METWLLELQAGRGEAAWDAFLERHRGLLFAAIRHYVDDHDEVMDAFAWVCEGLRRDDFRRLRSYAAETPNRARFTTWLVAVVRNLCVDWLRRRDGRARMPSALQGVSDVQRRIWEEVFGRGRSHAEAFEIIRSRDDPSMTFGAFLKDLAALYRVVMPLAAGLPREFAAPAPLPEDVPHEDEAAHGDTARVLADALGRLSSEERVAVEMYVVDGVSAADIARMLGLANSKAVYNRVYRALAAVRETIEQSGISRSDL